MSCLHDAVAGLAAVDAILCHAEAAVTALVHR
jgi:hypothetical protein